MECDRKDLCQTGYSNEQTQHEGFEDEEEDDKEEEEEENGEDGEGDEEGEDGEEGDEEGEGQDMEDGIDDNEDEEDEGDDEDDDEDDEGGDHGDQEQQQNYSPDFELEQRDERVGVTHLSNGVASVATGLVSPVASRQQQVHQAGRMEGSQPVGVDIKPSIRDDWTEPATHALLDAWGERYVQLNKGNLKQEDWEEVAMVVSSMGNVHKTDVQCKNRLDTLKKKYKVEKQKQSAIGSSDSKWPFYKQLDKLLNATTKQAGIPGAVDAGQRVKSSALDSFRGEHFRGVRKFEVEDPLVPPNNASTCSRSKESPDVTYSSAQNATGRDGTQSGARKRKGMDPHFKTLAKSITKIGEIYEKMEQSKQQQLMDLEKIRMEFTRDLELQRMQLFMQTQVELAKMKYGGNDMEATISNLSG
ncbi:unnamed protein product [Calypogeia fissa]